MKTNFAETTAKICRLKALLNALEEGMVELAEQLNGDSSAFCTDEGYDALYAETAALDSQINSMLVFCANSEAVALA